MTSLDILENILRENDIHRVFVSRIIESGRVQSKNLEWDDHFVQNLISKCKQIENRTGKRLLISIPEAGMFRKDSKLKQLLLRMIGLELPKTCGAGAWTMHIDSDGDCSPCFAFENKYSNGNLLEHPLSQIWQDIQIGLPKTHINTCAVEVNSERY